ncbi:aminoglycoside 6-adenylyltransferase [Clostridium hydrogeniformans]|uniref:aminoglycoside 6-adenylyltransferase n=1 Tax=Clostridium hydrogeniformans TaxID=349933 RepID=UPI000483D146|nr:aminoglycoside 6-adenylyltransferase [Clostridium hydrogeniformans]
MRSEEEIMDSILKTAKEDGRIRAVYMSGSRIDPNATHDKYSDFDIVYIVKDIRSFTNNEQWLDGFGDLLIMQKPVDWYNHSYDYNSTESFTYLMQFKDGNRIDLTLIDIRNIQDTIKDREPRVILLDKDKIDGLDTIEVGNYYYIQKPTAEEFKDCCNEFWWLSINVGKGLCREEFMFVKSLMEGYEMNMFLKMLKWKIGIDYDFSVSIGKHYKYLKRYLSKKDMDRFTNLFPNGTYNDIWDKFFETCKFFHEIESKVAMYFKFEYFKDEAENIMEYLNAMKEEKTMENG